MTGVFRTTTAAGAAQSGFRARRHRRIAAAAAVVSLFVGTTSVVPANVTSGPTVLAPFVSTTPRSVVLDSCETSGNLTDWPTLQIPDNTADQRDLSDFEALRFGPGTVVQAKNMRMTTEGLARDLLVDGKIFGTTLERTSAPEDSDAGYPYFDTTLFQVGLPGADLQGPLVRDRERFASVSDSSSIYPLGDRMVAGLEIVNPSDRDYTATFMIGLQGQRWLTCFPRSLDGDAPLRIIRNGQVLAEGTPEEDPSGGTTVLLRQPASARPLLRIDIPPYPSVEDGAPPGLANLDLLRALFAQNNYRVTVLGEVDPMMVLQLFRTIGPTGVGAPIRQLPQAVRKDSVTAERVARAYQGVSEVGPPKGGPIDAERIAPFVTDALARHLLREVYKEEHHADLDAVLQRRVPAEQQERLGALLDSPSHRLELGIAAALADPIGRPIALAGQAAGVPITALPDDIYDDRNGADSAGVCHCETFPTIDMRASAANEGTLVVHEWAHPLIGAAMTLDGTLEDRTRVAQAAFKRAGIDPQLAPWSVFETQGWPSEERGVRSHVPIYTVEREMRRLEQKKAPETEQQRREAMHQIARWVLGKYLLERRADETPWTDAQLIDAWVSAKVQSGGRQPPGKTEADRARWVEQQCAQWSLLTAGQEAVA